MEPRIFVIYHKSKAFYRDLLSYPDEPSYNRDNIILTKIAEWDKFFNLPFEEVRRRIVRIAFMGIENWECDGIINWREGSQILQKVGEQFNNTFYFQLDDDDWINPALFPLLKEKLQKKDYEAMCWDAIYFDCNFSQWWKDNPSYNYRKPLKDSSSLNSLVFHRKCKDTIKRKNKDAKTPGILFGGTYGFRIRPKRGMITGIHGAPHFDRLREGELLKLSDQPYFFRLLNPAGRGWLKHTSSIKDAHQLAINQLNVENH